jgi:ERCC4-related helicase
MSDRKRSIMPEGNDEDAFEPKRRRLEDWRSFFLADPVSPEEFEILRPHLERKLTEVIEFMNENGHQAFLDYKQQLLEQKERREKREKEIHEQALVDATVGGEARDYQMALFEICKKRNSIVHLGTGAGKLRMLLNVSNARVSLDLLQARL